MKILSQQEYCASPHVRTWNLTPSLMSAKQGQLETKAAEVSGLIDDYASKIFE